MKQLQAYQKLQQVAMKFDKSFFSTSDLTKIFPHDAKYIHIYTHRLVKSGILEPIQKGIYLLANSLFDPKKLSCQIYAPSYISLQTALSIHGIINQGTYDITLLTTNRPKTIIVNHIQFIYHKINPSLFFGYTIFQGTAIANLEKTVLDSLYFVVNGKLHIDIYEWNYSILKDLNTKLLAQYLKEYTPNIRKKLLNKLHKLNVKI